MKTKTKQTTIETPEVIETPRLPYWQRVCILGVPWLLTTAGWLATNHGALLILMIGLGMMTLGMALGGRMMTSKERMKHHDYIHTTPGYSNLPGNIYN